MVLVEKAFYQEETAHEDAPPAYADAILTPASSTVNGPTSLVDTRQSDSSSSVGNNGGQYSTVEALRRLEVPNQPNERSEARQVYSPDPYTVEKIPGTWQSSTVQSVSSPEAPSTPRVPSPGKAAVARWLSRRNTESPLEDPIVIPQPSNDPRDFSHVPFVKAYPPCLETLNPPLSSEEFLKFITSLNEAVSSHGALDAVTMVGTFISHLPVPIVANLLGTAIRASAGAGASSLSKSRSGKFLSEANETLFKPRGLFVEIMETAEMLEFLDMPEEARKINPPPIENYTAPLDMSAADKTQVDENWMRRMTTNMDNYSETRRSERRDAQILRTEYRHARRQQVLGDRGGSYLNRRRQRELKLHDRTYQQSQHGNFWGLNDYATSKGKKAAGERLWLVITPMDREGNEGSEEASTVQDN